MKFNKKLFLSLIVFCFVISFVLNSEIYRTDKAEVKTKGDDKLRDKYDVTVKIANDDDNYKEAMKGQLYTDIDENKENFSSLTIDNCEKIKDYKFITYDSKTKKCKISYRLVLSKFVYVNPNFDNKYIKLGVKHNDNNYQLKILLPYAMFTYIINDINGKLIKDRISSARNQYLANIDESINKLLVTALKYKNNKKLEKEFRDYTTTVKNLQNEIDQKEESKEKLSQEYELLAIKADLTEDKIEKINSDNQRLINYVNQLTLLNNNYKDLINTKNDMESKRDMVLTDVWKPKFDKYIELFLTDEEKNANKDKGEEFKKDYDSKKFSDYVNSYFPW